MAVPVFVSAAENAFIGRKGCKQTQRVYISASLCGHGQSLLAFLRSWNDTRTTSYAGHTLASLRTFCQRDQLQ